MFTICIGAGEPGEPRDKPVLTVCSKGWSRGEEGNRMGGNWKLKNKKVNFNIFFTSVKSFYFNYCLPPPPSRKKYHKPELCVVQGYNARKVISEVYTSFVLQCTVSGW